MLFVVSATVTVAVFGSVSASYQAWADTPTPPAKTSSSEAVPRPSIEPSTPTTTGDEQDAASDASSDPWLVGLIGAFAGALITVVLERLRDRYLEIRAFKTMLQAVKEEAAELARRSHARADFDQAHGIDFSAPLSTLAWSTLMSSGLSWRVAKDPHLYSELAKFYTDVNNANHCSQLALNLFALSQQSDLDPVLRRGFYERARTLTIEPFSRVEGSATAASAEIERVSA